MWIKTKIMKDWNQNLHGQTYKHIKPYIMHLPGYKIEQ